jgi:hypothetical protein
MQLYLAQFVVAKANLYHSDQPPYELVRKEISYRIQAQLFIAPGAELAYVKSLQMIWGFTDAHCDGPGSRTDFKCIGIYELEEIALGERSISEYLEGPYGIDVGSVRTDDIVPIVRLHRDLAVFARLATRAQIQPRHCLLWDGNRLSRHTAWSATVQFDIQGPYLPSTDTGHFFSSHAVAFLLHARSWIGALGV